MPANNNYTACIKRITKPPSPYYSAGQRGSSALGSKVRNSCFCRSGYAVTGIILRIIGKSKGNMQIDDCRLANVDLRIRMLGSRRFAWQNETRGSSLRYDYFFWSFLSERPSSAKAALRESLNLPWSSTSKSLTGMRSPSLTTASTLLT